MYGVALYLGTSGFRAQLIDLEKKATLKTVITMGHPLPGGNVMDHLDFAITTGEDVAHGVIIETIRRMLLEFNIDLSKIERLAVCGNPIQLSLFQNTEIRDFVFYCLIVTADIRHIRNKTLKSKIFSNCVKGS